MGNFAENLNLGNRFRPPSIIYIDVWKINEKQVKLSNSYSDYLFSNTSKYIHSIFS